jgi:hypothetical protein
MKKKLYEKPELQEVVLQPRATLLDYSGFQSSREGAYDGNPTPVWGN